MAYHLYFRKNVMPLKTWMILKTYLHLNFWSYYLNSCSFHLTYYFWSYCYGSFWNWSCSKNGCNFY